MEFVHNNGNNTCATPFLSFPSACLSVRVRVRWGINLIVALCSGKPLFWMQLHCLQAVFSINAINKDIDVVVVVAATAATTAQILFI